MQWKIYAMVLLWVFKDLFTGYPSAQLYKILKGTERKKNALQTAFMFPGIIFCIFFVLNALIWGEKSSNSVTLGQSCFCLFIVWNFHTLCFYQQLLSLQETCNWRSSEKKQNFQANSRTGLVTAAHFRHTHWWHIIIWSCFHWAAFHPHRFAKLLWLNYRAIDWQYQPELPLRHQKSN